jgi:sulfur carrier protein ThiS
LLGFDIVRTDALPKATAANVAKDTLDASVTVATDDNPIAMLVDFDFVHYAKTEPKIFYEADKVELQGDAMNALLVMGASRERKDDVGVVMISADA